MIAIGLDEKDGDRLYDSAILVDRAGKLLWKHRSWGRRPFKPEPISDTASTMIRRWL